MAFISTKYRPVFTGEAMPRLTTLYRAETLYTSMPRTMHRHEDVAEFILITEGSGIHIIDGQRYYTQKGDLLDVMAARAGNLDFRQALVIRSPLQDLRFSQVVQQHRFRQQFTIHGIAEELLVILDQAQSCLEIRCDMRDQAAWIRVMTAPACTGSIPEIQFILDFGENLVDRVLFFDISSGQQCLAAGFLARLIRVFLQDQRLRRFQSL